jgi:hypothetical protein
MLAPLLMEVMTPAPPSGGTTNFVPTYIQGVSKIVHGLAHIALLILATGYHGINTYTFSNR